MFQLPKMARYSSLETSKGSTIVGTLMRFLQRVAAPLRLFLTNQLFHRQISFDFQKRLARKYALCALVNSVKGTHSNQLKMTLTGLKLS